jgi:hypothetical protein
MLECRPFRAWIVFTFNLYGKYRIRKRRIAMKKLVMSGAVLIALAWWGSTPAQAQHWGYGGSCYRPPVVHYGGCGYGGYGYGGYGGHHVGYGGYGGHYVGYGGHYAGYGGYGGHYVGYGGRYGGYGGGYGYHH